LKDAGKCDADRCNSKESKSRIETAVIYDNNTDTCLRKCWCTHAHICIIRFTGWGNL